MKTIILQGLKRSGNHWLISILLQNKSFIMILLLNSNIPEEKAQLLSNNLYSSSVNISQCQLMLQSSFKAYNLFPIENLIYYLLN